ncbi:VP2 [Kundal virus]|uniref:VP2 n=1 Tax=Kundal virus TaxID=2290890 RepID=A0A499RQU0_9REOV|nr:VP2 [Kundal virus]AXG65494.1 VP2 [Kundal virus]
MHMLGNLLTQTATTLQERNSEIPIPQIPDDNLDQLLTALKQFANVSKIVPSASLALEPNDLIKPSIVTEGDGIKGPCNGLVLLESLPHFYQLSVKKIGLSAGVGGALSGTHGTDVFPFSKSMKENFGTGFDYSYVRIKTENFGFDLFIDPLEMEKTYCRVNGKEALGIGLTNQTCAPEIKYNDVKNPSEMMQFIIFVIAGAAKAGRWIYVAKDEDGKKYLFKDNCWIKVPGIQSFRRIQGWLANDNYDDYPHVPEAMIEYNQYKWFQQEVQEEMTNNGLGTTVNIGDNGPLVEADFNRKMGEPVYANVDFVSSECHANVLEELIGERMSINDYINILQMCQLRVGDIVGNQLQVMLKRYKRETMMQEVEMSWLLTFPSSEIYYATYKQAFLISPNFRLYVLSTLMSTVQSRISFIQLIPGPEAFSIFETRENINISTMQGLPIILAEWQSLLSTVDPIGICQRIVYDIMSPFTNICARFEDFGAPTPSKLLFVLVGAKISLLLNPNLYASNLHVKARLFHAIFSTFFKNEVSLLVGTRGYATDVRGQPQYLNDPSDITRYDTNVHAFTVLENIPNMGDDQRRRRWQLMRRIQEWLLQDQGIIYQREVGGIRYYTNRRVIRVPGRPFVPQRVEGGGILPAYGLLIGVIGIIETYVDHAYAAEGISHPAYKRDVLQIIQSNIQPYLYSFAEWFHWVYCPLYLQVALHPMIWWSHETDDTAWRNFHCVRENPALINQHHLHGAPFTKPTPGLLNNKDIFPFTAREGLDIFTRIHADGNAYKGGASDPDALIVIEKYHNLWQSNDSEQMVDEYVRAMYGSRELMEGLRLICELSTGTLFENIEVHEYIRAAFINGRLPSRTYYQILNLYGIKIDDKVLAQLPGGFMREKLHGDFRVYFPQTGYCDRDGTFVCDRVRGYDPIRRSVRQNVNILLEAIFNGDYGMIKFRMGMTLSLMPRNDLLFSSTHRLFNIYCILTTDVTMEYQPEMARMIRYFNAVAGWRDAHGQEQHVMLKVKTMHDLLEALRPFVGGNVEGVTFVIQDTRRVNEEVYNFIREAVENRQAVVYFPTLRGILHHSICSIMTVTGSYKKYEMDTFEMLRGMADTSMVRMNVVETIHVRGGVLTDNVVKPLLPIRPGVDDWVFCTDVNTCERRSKGVRVKIRDFFPPLAHNEGWRPWVEDGGNKVRGYPRYPYGLRSIIFVRHFNPLFKPKVAFCAE